MQLEADKSWKTTYFLKFSVNTGDFFPMNFLESYQRFETSISRFLAPSFWYLAEFYLKVISEFF